jgi:AcrR family transcriptional regulator
MGDVTQTRSGATRLGTPTLTASDWTEAALQLIAEKGLGALTVSALCERLDVTKGSFYWHFAGRAELLAATLSRWEERTTSEAIRALDAVADYRRRLELILEAAFQPPRARSLYAALAEATDDPIVGAALNRVATARIEYLEICYHNLGMPAAAAKARAALAYSSYRGLLQLAREAPNSLPTDWSAYRSAMREAFIPPSRGGQPATKPKKRA